MKANKYRTGREAERETGHERISSRRREWRLDKGMPWIGGVIRYKMEICETMMTIKTNAKFAFFV